MGQPSPNHSDRRLDSWKDIASFFGRDERTVRRWEKENSLPVHRVPAGAKGRVFAYETELHQWLSSPQSLTGTASPDRQATDVQTDRRHLNLHSLAVIAAAVAASAVLASGILILRHYRFAVHASAPTVPAVAKDHASAEAQDLYLKGRYYWNKRTPEGLNKAVDYFTQALVRDPGFAPAYVGLADTYNLLREYTPMPSSEAYPRALAAAKKAVELDDQSSDAHASLAFTLFYGMWDAADADHEFRRAIDLNPNNSCARHWYATYLMTVQKFPESLTEIERAQALDPSSTSVLADKGLILLFAGRRPEGLKLLKQIETSEPQFRSPHVYLKNHYLATADYPNFLDELKKDSLILGDKSSLQIASAAEHGFAIAGAQGMFKRMLDVQKQLYNQGLTTSFDLARSSALLGHKQESLRYLNTAFDQHDESVLTIQNFAEFSSLQNEPAYRDLIARLNLP